MGIVEGEYGSDVVYWIDEHFNPPYGIAEALERLFGWYGVAGYPYVAVDGSRGLLGASSCEGAAADLRVLINERLAETGGISPVEIVGTFQADDVSLEFNATFRLLDPATLTDLRGTFVAIEDIHDGGEDYPRVNRAIRYETVSLVNPGDEVDVYISIPCDPQWDPHEMAGVVFLQQTSDPKPVIQAAVLPDASAIEPDNGQSFAFVSMIDSMFPNPCAGSTEIRYTVSEAASSGIIRLEVFDTGGRRVRSLLAGDADPGQHVWSWDGLSDHGERLLGGVYFVRLQTREGEDRRKLILMH